MPPKGARASGRPASAAVTGAAAQCVTLMGTLLAFAVQRGLRADNPAHGVKKPPVRKMGRFLSERRSLVSPQRLIPRRRRAGNLLSSRRDQAAAIDRLPARRDHRIAMGAYRFRDGNACAFPTAETREKVIYLNPPALALLTELPRISGNPYVIAGDRAGIAVRRDRQGLVSGAQRSRARRCPAARSAAQLRQRWSRAGG